MISREVFINKQLLFIFTTDGEKISISNENIVVKNKDGDVIHKSSCYRLFAVFIIGDTSITTPLIKISKKFMFSIYFMNANMKIYEVLGARMEGNTLLREKQYSFNDHSLGQYIILNKMNNQLVFLKKKRKKDEKDKQVIKDIERIIKEYKKNDDLSLHEIMGYEGAVAKIYFSSFFKELDWKSRKPRIKIDYINTTMDIGYSILFNFVDAILSSYGFDNYCGILHSRFYNRKSLVCDIIEPMRPLIDYKIRKNINLGVFKKSDFKKYGERYLLEWKYSKKYVREFAKVLNDNKEEIFLYIQSYYRSFMKGLSAKDFPVFEVI